MGIQLQNSAQCSLSRLTLTTEHNGHEGCYKQKLHQQQTINAGLVIPDIYCTLHDCKLAKCIFIFVFSKSPNLSILEFGALKSLHTRDIGICRHMNLVQTHKCSL